ERFRLALASFSTHLRQPKYLQTSRSSWFLLFDPPQRLLCFRVTHLFCSSPLLNRLHPQIFRRNYAPSFFRNLVLHNVQPVLRISCPPHPALRRCSVPRLLLQQPYTQPVQFLPFLRTLSSCLRHILPD